MSTLLFAVVVGAVGIRGIRRRRRQRLPATIPPALVADHVDHA